jgi:hypothetical protein
MGIGESVISAGTKSAVRSALVDLRDVPLAEMPVLVLQPHHETLDSAFVVEPLGAGLVAPPPV